MYEVVVTYLDGETERIVGVDQRPSNSDDEYIVYQAATRTSHYFPKRQVRKMTFGQKRR